MTEPDISKICSVFGLNVKRSLPMQSGYRNQNYPLKLANGKTVNLIIYKREAGMQNTIRSANRIGTYLSDNGFPARCPYDSRILQIHAPPQEQFAAVYEYLPGSTIPWEAYTMAHLKQLGKTMAEMHNLLNTQPKKQLPTIPEVYSPTISRMQDYFNCGAVTQAISKKLRLNIDNSAFLGPQTLIKIADHLPAPQPLHLDFVRSNILFAENSAEITGVLDFEKAAYGAPVFDIARTLAFLLVDCKFKTEEQIRKYFLTSGYYKPANAKFTPPKIIITGQTINLLEQAINMFLFYDFYKFLRHNPYESLSQNEHYTRTSDLLVVRGVIRCV